MASSMILAMTLIYLAVLGPGLFPLKPLIGQPGVIVELLAGVAALPWLWFELFYQAEATGFFELIEPRGGKKRER